MGPGAKVWEPLVYGIHRNISHMDTTGCLSAYLQNFKMCFSTCSQYILKWNNFLVLDVCRLLDTHSIHRLMWMNSLAWLPSKTRKQTVFGNAEKAFQMDKCFWLCSLKLLSLDSCSLTHLRMHRRSWHVAGFLHMLQKRNHYRKLIQTSDEDRMFC